MTVPFHLPDPHSLTLDLPLPPSTNAIWKRSKRGIIRSQEYRDWIRQCDVVILSTGGLKGKQTIHGPCEVHLSFSIEKGHGDADNRIKAVLDYCQRIELVDNDKLIMRGTWEWAKPSAAPLGCRVTLRELAG